MHQSHPYLTSKQFTLISLPVQVTARMCEEDESSNCCKQGNMYSRCNIWQQLSLIQQKAMSHVFNVEYNRSQRTSHLMHDEGLKRRVKKSKWHPHQQQRQQQHHHHHHHHQWHRHQHFSSSLLQLNAPYLLLVLLCVLLVHPICGWQENIQPKHRITSLNQADVQRFSTGNNSLKLLEQDGDSLLIGGRNVMYNISLSTLTENKRLEWFSSETGASRCRLKGKSEEDCQNYIRVMARKSSDVLFVCGTNAFSPACRNYTIKGASSSSSWYEPLGLEGPGEGLCPYGPKYNLVTTFAEDNLYVATVAHFSGTDPIIYRKPLRSHQYNPKHLNAPNFVNSFYHDGQVFFFFRETAVEHINCGKQIYSRVARVCTKDKGGGTNKYGSHWTTFLKSRLNCSIPGEFPFYFDEIQSTSNLVKGIYNGRSDQIIYGVFTTPVNSLGSSAICAFRMADIMSIFETGQFKGQENSDSNWLPVPASRVPSPRPGVCVNDSKLQSDQQHIFIREHPLMDSSVPSFHGRPILIQSSFKFRFTQIAVDPQIQTVSGAAYDVLFVATDDGRVMKMINSQAASLKPVSSASSSGNNNHNNHNNHNSNNNNNNNNNNAAPISPVIIEEITVFPNRVPITNLLVYHTYYEAKLVVMSDSEIQAIPLHKCQSRATTCSACISLQDPYCAWDKMRSICTSSRNRFVSPENYIQNVEDAWDSRCDGGGKQTSYTPLTDNNIAGGSSSSSSSSSSASGYPADDAFSTPTTDPLPPSPLCTAETMAFAVVTSIIASFVVGFILGHIISRRCKKDSHFDHTGLAFHPYSDPTGYTDYQITGALGARDVFPPSSTYGMIGLNDERTGAADSIRPTLISGTNATLHNGGHLPGHLVNSQPGKPINLVLNVQANSKGGKNANSSADNKPLAQKVNKIYL